MTHSDKAALRGEPSYVWRSGQERRLRMIERWVDLNGTVLDNGCGLGAYLEKFGRYPGNHFGNEIEEERAAHARDRSDGVVISPGEFLAFADNSFDTIFSNEVVEHVQNDRMAVQEMVRVTRVGGRILIFCPNRWYPVEQHGIYWRGVYRFGNIPLVNYLPNVLRNRLAPHVAVYTKRGLQMLFAGLPVKVVQHTRIYGGYDNIEYRLPRIGRIIKKTLYTLEQTPLNVFGISHLLVLEKVADAGKTT